jgi:hypothetical protein
LISNKPKPKRFKRLPSKLQAVTPTLAIQTAEPAVAFMAGAAVDQMVLQRDWPSRLVGQETVADQNVRPN